MNSKRLKKISIIGMITMITIMLMILASASPVLAQSGSIKLLAVSESTGGLVGSIAHLYLDIEPGQGRIFIDTLPTAKIDTQLSTRFAKDMACKYLNLDCSNLDFFYTIRADSPIVGGPSAGAAITTLTISLLEGIDLDEDTVITGTINSGELIGPVGGVKEKIDAAARENLSKVLIPAGERHINYVNSTNSMNNTNNRNNQNNRNNTNNTLDVIEYGQIIGIDVVEVSTIDDVLYHYTGKIFDESDDNVSISPMYKDTMGFLAESLCERSIDLKKQVSAYKVSDISIIDADFSEDKKRAENLTQEGIDAFSQDTFYSAASYCFGANVRYKSLIYKMRDMDREEAISEIEDIKEEVEDLKKEVSNREIRTITDLQAYMIVMDRIEEAEDYLNLSRINANNNSSRLPDNLAFALERYNSAISWSKFFGQKGKRFRISDAEIMRSCINKISEAEEHHSYIDYLFSGLLADTKKEISNARKKYNNEEYVLCLYKATLAKANIGVVSSTIGIEKEGLQDLLDRKLKAAEKSIAEQQDGGIFPILGYSYYEYAQSLRDRDIFSALLYSEYALELSTLDIYFEPEKISLGRFNSSDTVIFFSGMALGIMFAVMVMVLEKVNNWRKSKRKSPKHKKIKFKFRKK
ncbi:hypothetical protein GF345_04950 [Candidatus Woesearchaeota archaeon]|nr:hypothetical protein [Candidatus Woesearchaeota archaeon]